MPEPKALHVLIAPLGQLSGNGQLRETVRERRKRNGDDVPFWYLSPELVKRFNISGNDVEAVVALDLTAINWLRLRFGGEYMTAQLDVDELLDQAKGLPPGPAERDISD